MGRAGGHILGLEGARETGVLHIKRETSTKKIVQKYESLSQPPPKAYKNNKAKNNQRSLVHPQEQGRDQALQVRVTVANPVVGRAQDGQKHQTQTRWAEGGDLTRPPMCTLHDIHKELTGVAHGHVEALAACCQFGGHRTQVSDWRGPRGLHRWRDGGWKWGHHDHHHGVVGEGCPGGRCIRMEPRLGSEIRRTP